MNLAQEEAITNFAEKNNLHLLAFVPFDQQVIDKETLGETPLKFKEIGAVRAINDICEGLVKQYVK